MALSSEIVAQPEFVEAELTYTVDTGVKPVTGTTVPGGRLRQRSGTFEQRRVRIRNGRLGVRDFAFDRDGFVLVEHDTAVSDFYDEQELRSVYYPEIQGLIRNLTGATRVMVFDHTIRTGDEDEQEAKRLREPVRVVHNDYTEWSGPQRLRDLVSREEAKALLQHRIAVIQVWRPIQTSVYSNPLAICAAQSVASSDLIAAERRHADRVGEIYQLAFNPDHQWFYFPNMRLGEALVFKCYDSEKDGRSRFTAHGSFDDPNTPDNAPPRESIEVRTLAIFES